MIQDIGRLVRGSIYLIAFAFANTFLGVTVGWLSIVVIVILILGVLMVKPMVQIDRRRKPIIVGLSRDHVR